MNHAVILPTTRDEGWRYADAAALAAADPAALASWRELSLPAGERLTQTRVIDRAGVDRLRVHVGPNAHYAHFAINAGPGYARCEIEATLEQGASFTFGGVTIGGGDATQEFVTRVMHAAPEGASNQIVRAVQWGRATGNFLGAIEVARDAQKTDAAQNFRAILLERGASANAKPELEIFADDVKCAHGAAIGALDEMAGFYMAARGIPPEAARRLLVRAFIADAFAALEDEALRDNLVEQAVSRLEGSAL